MPIEVVILNWLSGPVPTTTNDPPNPQTQKLSSLFRTQLLQPGCRLSIWGHEIENPSTFRIFTDWDTIQHHRDFQASEGYKDWIAGFRELIDPEGIMVFHVHLDDMRGEARRVWDGRETPACETLLVYFPADYGKEDQDTFATNFLKLVNAVRDNAPQGDYTGYCGGWVEELLPIPDSAKDGVEPEKGKVYAGFIGWSSVEAHMKFRETEAFKENIHWLRGAKALRGVKMVHFRGVEVVEESK